MPPKVLIVDDEANIVLALEFLMQQAGFATEVAYDGVEGLAKLATFAPDLVLLDVMMPRLNGYDFCQQVRANPAWQRVKLLLLTAKGREAEQLKGRALGADGYIVKPFSTQELVAEVRRQLGVTP